MGVDVRPTKRAAESMARAILRRCETTPNGMVAVFYEPAGVVVTPTSGDRYDLSAMRRQMLGIYNDECERGWLEDDLLAFGLATA